MAVRRSGSPFLLGVGSDRVLMQSLISNRLRALRRRALFWLIVGAWALSSCGKSPAPSTAVEKEFQSELHKAFHQGALANCKLTVTTESVNIGGESRDIGHIKVVVPDLALMSPAVKAVEKVAARQKLSFKQFTSSKNSAGFVLYEIAQGQQRISSVLLLPASAAGPPAAGALPDEESVPPLFSLPKVFHGDYKVAIIIDDLGADLNAAEQLSRFPEAITFSILPEQKFTRETAEIARNSGKEVMVHLPMEPEAREGLAVPPKAILTSMSPQEVESIFTEDVASVPYAVGINNHMGSKATPNRAVMMEVLALTKLHGLFFIDSRTTPATAAYSVARELGVRTNFRSVFLDDQVTVAYTEHQLDILLHKMLQQGSAIAIGHPFSTTIEALRRRLPEFERRGVKVVFASDLVS